jgi:hypothetical protein
VVIGISDFDIVQDLNRERTPISSGLHASNLSLGFWALILFGPVLSVSKEFGARDLYFLSLTADY